ncbi:MAG: TerB family tellurite resistance protein [Myxococcota bacterium]
MSSVEDRILVITDLLLGAVYADQKLEGEEEAAVRRLLAELLGGGELPAEVDERINDFPAGRFDLQKAARDFGADPPIRKRQLLELVAAVRDADGEIDLAEDEYMRELGEALGMSESEYADLTLDYEVEDLRDSLEALRRAPAS